MKKYIALSVLLGACALNAMEEKKIQGINAGWGCVDDTLAAAAGQRAGLEAALGRHGAQSPIMRDNVDDDGSSSSGRSLQTAQAENGDALKALTTRLEQMEIRLKDQEYYIRLALQFIIAQNNDGPLGDEVRANFRADALKKDVSSDNNDDDSGDEGQWSDE